MLVVPVLVRMYRVMANDTMFKCGPSFFQKPKGKESMRANNSSTMQQNSNDEGIMLPRTQHFWRAQTQHFIHIDSKTHDTVRTTRFFRTGESICLTPSPSHNSLIRFSCFPSPAGAWLKQQKLSYTLLHSLPSFKE